MNEKMTAIRRLRLVHHDAGIDVDDPRGCAGVIRVRPDEVSAAVEILVVAGPTHDDPSADVGWFAGSRHRLEFDGERA